MLFPIGIVAAALAFQPVESRLCGVAAEGNEARYLVVPDAHDFPRGFNLNVGERLVVVPCRDVLRADGYPDAAKLKKVLSDA